MGHPVYWRIIPKRIGQVCIILISSPQGTRTFFLLLFFAHYTSSSVDHLLSVDLQSNIIVTKALWLAFCCLGLFSFNISYHKRCTVHSMIVLSIPYTLRTKVLHCTFPRVWSDRFMGSLNKNICTNKSVLLIHAVIPWGQSRGRWRPIGLSSLHLSLLAHRSLRYLFWPKRSEIRCGFLLWYPALLKVWHVWDAFLFTTVV